MKSLLKEIRHNPLLWLLVFVPVVFAAQNLKPGAHTLLFVLSVLASVPLAALLSYIIGPTPMDLQFWPGAVIMMLIATLTASFVTNSGKSAWFVGVLVLMVYLIFAMTLYLLPPDPKGSRALEL
jgi:Ca2+/H+ antiporter